MKVIFLDFDGVLVNRRSLATASGCHATGDPACVAVLNRIVKATGAKIVVSSMWRIGMTVIELRQLLKQWGVDGGVIDRTPHLGYSALRGSEIALWLETYRAKRGNVEKFVILDDDADMGELLPFLVQTEFDDGLLDIDADRAIELLTCGGQDSKASACKADNRECNSRPHVQV